MKLSEQEKNFLIDELDDYFEEVQMQSTTFMESEMIVSLLDQVLMDERIEDQESAAREKVGQFIWDHQVCYGIESFSSGLSLNGKPFRYQQGEVINVTEIFRILKRIEDVDFEIQVASNDDRARMLANAKDLSRGTNVNELREKLKPFKYDADENS